MAFSELIKNFDTIRAYIRDFYVYGFKRREQYDAKSARSYDDARRRIDSWLGEYMRFETSSEGKNVFLSVDARRLQQNPFYKAFKTKSFTDGDITLHFLLFDILYSPKEKMSLSELIQEVDRHLAAFESPLQYDESTLRKKLAEYVGEGIIVTEKAGKKLLYSRAPDTDIAALSDAVDFFAETAPLGVVGSYLQDKGRARQNVFSFKHHYMTQALDSEIACALFKAMQEKREVTLLNLARRAAAPKETTAVPVKLFVGVQNGKQNLIAYIPAAGRFVSYRLDYLLKVTPGAECPDFDGLRARFSKIEKHMWGVNCPWDKQTLERVEMTLFAGEDEEYIVRRLEREKRCGSIERLDATHWRFTADVYDSNEMLPWLRTFICRITDISFSNKALEKRFRADLEEMYKMYDGNGGERV